MVRVEMPRQDAYQHCKACLTFSSKDTMVLLAQNDCGAVPGDHVEITLEESGFLSATLLLYGCLLQSFLLSMLMASQLFSQESVVFLISLLLLAITYGVLHAVTKKNEPQPLHPRAVRVLNSPNKHPSPFLWLS